MLPGWCPDIEASARLTQIRRVWGILVPCHRHCPVVMDWNVLPENLDPLACCPAPCFSTVPFSKFHVFSFPIRQMALSVEEAEFPIAFSIAMFTDVEQTERLLRAIYQPQNLYCIHVDTKSSLLIHRTVAAIARCFDNVWIATRLDKVKWGDVRFVPPPSHHHGCTCNRSFRFASAHLWNQLPCFISSVLFTSIHSCQFM